MIYTVAKHIDSHISLTTSWFIPLVINSYFIAMLTYVNICREPKIKRMTFPEFLSSFRFINIIALAVQTTVGFYSKQHGRQLVKPLWQEPIMTNIGVTIIIYLLFILIYTLIIKVNYD